MNPIVFRHINLKVLADYTIIIPGHPAPWARAGRQIINRPGAAPYVHTFDTNKQIVNKRDIRIYAHSAGAIKDPPPEGPIRMTMVFYMARPKRLMRAKDPDGPIPSTARPDLDNLEKLVLDALNTVAYKDDSQVFERQGLKLYCEKGGSPRTEIYMEVME